MYLRRGFRNLQNAYAKNAVDKFREQYAGTKSIIHIADDPSNKAIVVFASKKVSLPEMFEGYRIINYNLRHVSGKCAELLKRIETEKVDLSMEENLFFFKLVSEGKDICDKLAHV